MKQNPTFPAVLEHACWALKNIAVNPENKVISGAAGAVQVHFSAPNTPPLKEEKNSSHYSAPCTSTTLALTHFRVKVRVRIMVTLYPTRGEVRVSHNLC